MEDNVLLLGYVTVPVDGLVIAVNKVAYQFLFATPLLMIMVTAVVKFFELLDSFIALGTVAWRSSSSRQQEFR